MKYEDMIDPPEGYFKQKEQEEMSPSQRIIASVMEQQYQDAKANGVPERNLEKLRHALENFYAKFQKRS